MLTPLGPSAVRMLDDHAPPAGMLPDEADTDAAARALRLTVLVPAHNERLTIAATLASLWGQTRPPERVIVVADNCDDDTADIARAARRGGVHHRRQHREEGRSAQPGAVGDVRPDRPAMSRW